ncbi:hypothetical protein LSAT2_031258 [Lamellibrachia satsuma]|nr:hypothetical protein LSAT2_031258 [Lamellibrachia satsuma]
MRTETSQGMDHLVTFFLLVSVIVVALTRGQSDDKKDKGIACGTERYHPGRDEGCCGGSVFSTASRDRSACCGDAIVFNTDFVICCGGSLYSKSDTPKC